MGIEELKGKTLTREEARAAGKVPIVSWRYA